MKCAPTYVLVTPARNEEAHLETTIRAVLAQTILPQKWVIVSDGSTDRTDDIVRQYANEHQFIHFVRANGETRRTFSSKVNAINLGYTHLAGLDYNFLGILDADVSFDPAYYESVISKFHNNEKLGVAGGVQYELYDGKLTKVLNARKSVGGAAQLFRRQCFEGIGGLTPVELGGEDTIAEVKARMGGWETECFPDIWVHHYRHTGTAAANFFKAKFRQGMRDYMIGNHPLFEIAKCVWRTRERPYVISSVLRMGGFVWASCRRYQRPVSESFLQYLRKEQMATLTAFVGKRSITTCLL